MKKAITLKDEEGNIVYPCPYYPVGAIYMSVNNHNPADIFGGEWEQIKDVFLLGCGSLYSNGATGGEVTHRLTINEMPSHNHKAVSTSGSRDTSIALYPFNMTQSNYNIVDANVIRPTGGNQAHNNMPPFLAVYIWKRIA